MKILKTYEILKMIDENPEEMIGRKFKQVGGLEGDEFKIGDIAVVTPYFGITSLGADKISRIRITLNGFEEWEELLSQLVTWQEAINAYAVDKKGFSIEMPNGKVYTQNWDYKLGILNVGTLKGKHQDHEHLDRRMFKEGKWYIEH